MTVQRTICAALAAILLATGGKTRPVEYAKERFERHKSAAAAVIVARV